MKIKSEYVNESVSRRATLWGDTATEGVDESECPFNHY